MLIRTNLNLIGQNNYLMILKFVQKLHSCTLIIVRNIKFNDPIVILSIRSKFDPIDIETPLPRLRLFPVTLINKRFFHPTQYSRRNCSKSQKNILISIALQMKSNDTHLGKVRALKHN